MKQILARIADVFPSACMVHVAGGSDWAALCSRVFAETSKYDQMNGCSLFNGLLKQTAVLMLLAGCTLVACTSRADASTYYVSSKVQSAPAHDGLTWQRAWTDMNQINWSIMHPGDTIEIDAGNTAGGQLIYRQPLVVRRGGTKQQPVTIKVSDESGHSAGQAMILLTKNTVAGLDFTQSNYVNVGGSTWKKMVIEGSTYGALVRDDNCHPSLMNIEIRKTTCGIRVLKGTMFGHQLIVHDNPTNILVESTNSMDWIKFNRCWIYNRDLPASNGYLVKNTNTRAMINESVVGPGLDVGIWADKNSGALAGGSLLLNAKTANVQLDNATENSLTLMMSECTSFMTPLNAQNAAHDCLKIAGKHTEWIAGSIVYGGTVQADGASMITNLQYKTSGNTLYLGSRIENPGFQSVDDIPNDVKNSDLCDTNGRFYQTATFYPRDRVGTHVHSIAELLGFNEAFKGSNQRSYGSYTF